MQNPAQSQVLKALKEANNVLVTVKNGPTVDELAAAIALTLMLNRMNKHAITVFSGRVPSMLEFLQPEMAIDTNTDSLRDFIIALDKSKADKLRYKVEDNVVRIFITPYKTSISEKDLEFSQGDFNVDVVVALGVVTKDDFDQAVTLHGRILHDATVIALTKQSTLSQIGAVNWQEQQASSVSEMVARLTDGLGEDVLDGQIATALMTGIVAETDRFRNNLTTPEVMTMSAKLMSAGANQQLIAEKLEAPDMTTVAQPLSYAAEPEHDDGTLAIAHSADEVQNIHIDDAGNLALPPELTDGPPQMPAAPMQNDMNTQPPAYQFGQMPVFNNPAAGPQPDFGMQPQPLAQDDDHLNAGRTYMEPTQHPRLYAEDDSGQVAAQPLFDGSQQPLNTALQASFPSQAQPLDARHKVIEPLPGGDEHGSYGKPFIPPVEPPVAIPTYTPPPELPKAPAPQPEPAPVVATEQPVEAPAPVSQVPVVDPHQTLADLEHAVGSAHAAPPPAQATNDVDDFLGTTRTPVQEAPQQEAPAVAPPEVAAQEEETEEEKKEDENLIKIPDQTVPQPAPQVINPNAPPEVPPPLMPSPTQPQFFDADGNSSNPFLNPN